MELAPTLDVVDGPCDDSEDVEDTPEPWGWMFSQNKGITAQDLVKDEYTFGRGDDCDYCFQMHNGRHKNPYYLSLSKTHFRIYREKRKPSDSDYTVIIEDKSSNGTFINGQKLGKNKKQVLNTDDEISLSLKKNRAFIYHDFSAAMNTSSLPPAFSEKYIMSKFLGKGACGEVKLAFERGTLKKFAVKTISKKTFSVGPVLGRAALDEVNILKSIHHPCIIRIEDVYDTPTTLYIVLELAEGGELYDRVVKEGKFSEETSKLFFYQMLMAIKYLHDRGITHRDIKPENILLESDEPEPLIKVTDFGLSRFVGENSLMKTLCGTPSYLAPEILESAGTTGYGKAVDLWSLGVMLFIMLGGYPPFSDEFTDHTLKEQITQARYSFPEQWWKGVSQDAIDMVKQLLTLDPKARITIAEALKHPWLQDEEVVGRAKKLMRLGSPFDMPPPPIPDRKRPAHFDGDPTDHNSLSFAVTEPECAKKPAKIPNLEEMPSTDSNTSDHTPSPNAQNGNGSTSEITTSHTNAHSTDMSVSNST